MIIRASKVTIKDGYIKIAWDNKTKYAIIPNQKVLEGVPYSLVELKGLNGFHKGFIEIIN